MIKRIIIGSDSLGYPMKKYLCEGLDKKGIEVVDCGCENETDATYYPIIAERVCTQLLNENAEDVRAVLICGTGLGMTICANKFEHIYAAHCHDMYSCERSILSNNSNVICFGAQIISNEWALELLDKWLSLTFADGRSTPKLKALKEMERRNFEK